MANRTLLACALGASGLIAVLACGRIDAGEPAQSKTSAAIGVPTNPGPPADPGPPASVDAGPPTDPGPPPNPACQAATSTWRNQLPCPNGLNCCSGACVDDDAGGVACGCKSTGDGTCTSNAECCSGTCNAGVCEGCIPSGGTCYPYGFAAGGGCCSGVCNPTATGGTCL